MSCCECCDCDVHEHAMWLWCDVTVGQTADRRHILNVQSTDKQMFLFYLPLLWKWMHAWDEHMYYVIRISNIICIFYSGRIRRYITRRVLNIFGQEKINSENFLQIISKISEPTLLLKNKFLLTLCAPFHPDTKQQWKRGWHRIRRRSSSAPPIRTAATQQRWVQIIWPTYTLLVALESMFVKCLCLVVNLASWVVA